MLSVGQALRAASAQVNQKCLVTLWWFLCVTNPVLLVLQGRDGSSGTPGMRGDRGETVRMITLPPNTKLFLHNLLLRGGSRARQGKGYCNPKRKFG